MTSLGNWINGNNAIVVADEGTFPTWASWGASQRELFLVNHEGFVVFEQNISGGLPSDLENLVLDLINQIPSDDTGGGDDCVCNEIWDPVCGVDGNTYSNSCYADCENVGIDYAGECEGDTNNCSAGYVEDCSGDGDCCSENWIGDGVGDCEDQAYGCDLTCYDNDGGDCSAEMVSNNSGLTYQQRERRAEHLPILVSLNNQQLREEILGYNVFKDGSHIAYVENTFHLDEDYLAGTTYCYSVSALYEESQSYQSAEVCVTTEGTAFAQGDVNTDEQINVLDIVMLVNMILGSETPNYQLGDLNIDGSWNVIDVIALVNCILVYNCNEIENGCTGDMNGDGSWNVIDVVSLANCILNASCEFI